MDGTFTADGNVTATADDISGLSATANDTVTMISTANISNVTADGETVVLTAENDIANAGVTADTATLTATNGSITTANVTAATATLTAANGNIANGAITADTATLTAGNEIDGTTVTADGAITATATTIASSAFISENDTITVDASAIDATSFLAKNANLDITTVAITGNSSFTALTGDVTLAAEQIVSATVNAGNDATVTANDEMTDVTIDASGEANVTAGTINSLVVDSNEATVTATDGDIVNANVWSVEVTMNAEDGSIIGSNAEGSNVTLTASNSIIDSGVTASNTATLTAENEIDTTNVTAGGAIDATATTIAASSFISETGDVNATATLIDATTILAKEGAITVDADDISGLTATALGDIAITAVNDIVNANADGENVTMTATEGSIINSGVYANVKAVLTAGDEIDGTNVTAQGTGLPETGEDAITAMAKYIGESSFIAENGDVTIGSEEDPVLQIRGSTIWAKLGAVNVYIDEDEGEFDGMALTAKQDLKIKAAYIIGSALISEEGNVDVTAKKSLGGTTVVSKHKDVTVDAGRIEANSAIDAIEGNITVTGTDAVIEDTVFNAAKTIDVQDADTISNANFRGGEEVTVKANAIDGSTIESDTVTLAGNDSPITIGADGAVNVNGAETITLDNAGVTNIVSNNTNDVTVNAINGGDDEVISITQNVGDLTVIDDGTLQIGQIKVDSQVTIIAEDDILDGTEDETANVIADKIQMTAVNGNIGDEEDGLNLLVKEITGTGITAENGGVYLTSDGAIKRDTNGRDGIADITAQTVKVDAADGIGEIAYKEDGNGLSDTVGEPITDGFIVIDGANNIELNTKNGNADIAVELENANTVDLVANATGNDSDIFVTTDDVKTLNLNDVSAIDGNVVIGAARTNVNAKHVRALDNGDKTGIVNDAHAVVIEGLNINVAMNGIRSDYEVDLIAHNNVTAAGDESDVNITTGGDINITVGGQVGSVEGNNPLTVDADGELHVDKLPGSDNNGNGKDIVWVYANGNTSDGAIHYDGKPNTEPGIIYWNGRVWGGNNTPVNQVSRAEGEFAKQIRNMIDAYNGKYWTVSQLIYFPHVYMMMDLKPQDMSIEHILNGRGTIDNLPDGVGPDTIDINAWDDSFSWYQGNGWKW